jgi:hypothetical protein
MRTCVPHACGVGVFLLILSGALPSSAQDTFADLNQKLDPGDSLIVSDTNGHRTRGSLVELTPSSLVLFTDGTRRTFEVSEIERVQRRKNGVLLGLLIGAGCGAALGAIVYGLDEDNSAAAAVWSVAIGAGIGLGIDAVAVVPRTVYRRPASGGLTPVPLDAVARGGGLGVRLSF